MSYSNHASQQGYNEEDFLEYYFHEESNSDEWNFTATQSEVCQTDFAHEITWHSYLLQTQSKTLDWQKLWKNQTVLTIKPISKSIKIKLIQVQMILTKENFQVEEKINLF